MASHELLRNLTLREIRSKYRRTALGQGWSLLNPIAQITIYSLVFSYVLQVSVAPGSPSGLKVFVIWLSAGLLPWLFFSTVVNLGLGALVGNANLIKKVYFPREALIVSALLSCLFSFMIELTVLHVAVLIFGGTVNPLLVPATLLITVLLSIFALGLTLILAVANVYFRDVQHLAALFLQAWFFASAIMYPATLISKRVGTDSTVYRMFRLNPIERFAEAYRNTIYDARLPALATIVYLAVFAGATLMLGHAIFRRLEGRLAAPHRSRRACFPHRRGCAHLAVRRDFDSAAQHSQAGRASASRGIVTSIRPRASLG
jgi:ABC-type polysaccharide/polyol phosphate export permease